jgi:hypothetical protein
LLLAEGRRHNNFLLGEKFGGWTRNLVQRHDKIAHLNNFVDLTHGKQPLAELGHVSPVIEGLNAVTSNDKRVRCMLVQPCLDVCKILSDNLVCSLFLLLLLCDSEDQIIIELALFITQGSKHRGCRRFCSLIIFGYRSTSLSDWSSLDMIKCSYQMSRIYGHVLNFLENFF